MKFLLDLAILAIIAYIVYIKFFKPKKDIPQADDGLMVSCDCCGVYIEKKDAIEKNSKIYCSDECAKKEIRQ